MQFIKDSHHKLGVITVEHKGTNVVFDTSRYIQPDEFSDAKNLFTALNAWWSTLPADAQDQIFQIYVDAREVLDTVYDTGRRQAGLRRLIKRLMELNFPAQLKSFLIRQGLISYPSNIKDTYSPSDTVDLTYLRPHYSGLATLAVLLRMVVPIWGVFLVSLGRIENNTRDRLAVRLLGEACFTQEGGDLNEDYERLRNYVRTLTESKGAVPLSALVDSVGSEEFPEWIFSTVLLRRVALGELSRGEREVNIVSTVYAMVRYSNDSADRKFDGRISDKHGESASDDEDNASLMEAYKAKQDISPGQLAAYEVYTENLERLAKDIDPEVPMEKVKACFQAIREALLRDDIEITKHSLTLIRMIACKVIPERVVSHLPGFTPAEMPEENSDGSNLEELVKWRERAFQSGNGYYPLWNMVAVTQAVLWHHGFISLASMSTMKPIPRTQSFGQSVVMRQIPKDQVPELEAMYPHHRLPGNKTCLVDFEASKFIENLSVSDWICVAPLELRSKVENYREGQLEFTPPGNTRIEFAAFVKWFNKSYYA